MPKQHSSVLPNIQDKYGAEALFDPADALAAQGDGVPELPPAIILGYQEELTEVVADQSSDVTTIIRGQDCYWLSEAVGYVPVHESGIGAPVTAICTENVIEAGAEAVIMLGGCACLQPDIPADAAILPTSTIRDEGVSHHYVPSEQPLEPTESLLDSLDEALTAAGFDTPRGPTWTTSAMYRETLREIEQYESEGVVSLCMESAAIWAVCQYRDVDTATVHQIGDYLGTDEWTPDTDVDRGLPEMLDPTVRALAEYVGEA